MNEFDVLPVWVQKGDLDVHCIVFDHFGDGQRTEEDVREHAETVVQRAGTVEDIAIARTAGRDELLDGIVAHPDLSVEAFVLEIKVRAADPDLLPDERLGLVFGNIGELREMNEDGVLNTFFLEKID